MTLPRLAPVAAVLAVAMVAVILGLALPPGAVGAAPAPSSTANVGVSVIIPGSTATPTPTRSTTPSPSNSGSGGGSTSTPAPVGPGGEPIPPAQPSADAPALTLESTLVTTDDWLRATGSGYRPGEKVQFVLYPGAIVLGSVIADAHGTVTGTFRLPDGTRAGIHVLEATGWQSGFVRNAEFTVAAAAAVVQPWLWWVFVVVGVLLLSVIALGIVFRERIRSWFAPPVPVGSLT